jgi:hypothetical protein
MNDPRAEFFQLMQRYVSLGMRLNKPTANLAEPKTIAAEMDKVQAQIDVIIEKNAVR